MYDRILNLISENDLEKIKHTSILIIGLGGVGGYVLEALVRSGFQDLTVVDQDVFEESNLNRQILANRQVLGQRKVDVALQHALEIQPSIQIQPIYKSLTKEDITEEFIQGYDYLIDACDSVFVKAELIKVCMKNKKKIISCMGTANRFRADAFQILPLEKTMGDPLAKKLRSLLKNEKKCLKTKVVCSSEIPLKQQKLGTLAHVPMAAGSLLVSYVISDLLAS